MPQADASDTPRWQEYVPLHLIARATRNAKEHDPNTLRASINRFGFIGAIIMDERTGRLVGGHGRLDDLLAAEEVGVDPPDGVTVGDDGRWAVPVSRGWRSRNDLEADAAALALNRVGEGRYDGQMALLILSELSADATAGLVGTGWTAEDVRFMEAMDRQLGDGGPLSSPVDPPVPPTEFRTIDPDAETEHRCPACGFEWNGAAT